MKNAKLIGSLKELRTRSSRNDGAVWLKDANGGGWPIGDVRMVRLAKSKDESVASDAVGIALMLPEESQMHLRVRPLIRKLSHYPEESNVYAGFGSDELLPVTDVSLGKAATVVISAQGNPPTLSKRSKG